MMHAPEGREPAPLAEPPAPAVSLTSLFQQRGQDMLRLAYLLTGSKEMAEDVVQDAFLSLESRLSSVEVPVAYLRASVVNGARSGIRRQRTAAAYAHTLIEGSLEQPRDVELRDVLLRLAHRQRAAVVLRYYCQLSDPDIAEILGCRPATVRSLTRRALANLRRELRYER